MRTRPRSPKGTRASGARKPSDPAGRRETSARRRARLCSSTTRRASLRVRDTGGATSDARALHVRAHEERAERGRTGRGAAPREPGIGQPHLAAARPSRLFFLPVNESGRVPRSPRRAAKTQTNAYSQGQPAAGRRGGTRDRSYVKLEVYTTRTGRPDDHSYRTICTCMVFRLSALRLSLPAPLLRHSANRAGALEPSIPGQQSGKCLRSARNLL